MPTTSTDHSLKELAVELIDRERPRLAKAIARQIQMTVPRYVAVDINALAGSIGSVLGMVRPLVLQHDARKLAHLVEDIARLRIAGGFDVSEFMASSLCFLPVLRRYLVMKAGDAKVGLEMYEHVEAVILPFQGRVASIFLDSSLDNTDPGTFSGERFLSMMTNEEGSSPFQPVAISLVDEWDDDDIHDAATPPMGRRIR